MELTDLLTFAAVARTGGNVSDVYDQLRKHGIDWPYDEVWKFVPQAAPGATPTPWAHWAWGQMDPWFFDHLNAYARDTISSRRCRRPRSRCDVADARATSARPAGGFPTRAGRARSLGPERDS